MATIVDGVRIVWEGDLLSVRLLDASVKKRVYSSFDSEVLFEMDGSGTIVGVIVTGLDVLGREWLEHPDRKRLPHELARHVDKYALSTEPA